ncbi:MAG: plastocyanin/azurin family copper-binding protein [Verrucomicrobiota bacterium]|nr:plastocyanin/azurin family copper-binding protein [Verrucomicrobiota bacterium]
MKPALLSSLALTVAIVAGFAVLPKPQQAFARSDAVQGSLPGITVMDAEGRAVRSGVPAPSGQTFDVTVGPNGSLTFSPGQINVSVGDTVRWTWASNRHSVTSGISCAPSGTFCSPSDSNCNILSDAGAVYQHTFTQPGTYKYFCVAHCNFGMLGTVFVTAPCVAPPSGMVAWFPGDGSPRDIQNANNGVLENGATYAAGKVGQAFSFNGTTSDVLVADSAALQPTTQITIDAWVFPNAAAGPQDVVAMIVNKEINDSSIEYQLGRRNSANCDVGAGIAPGNFAFYLGGVTLPNECSSWVDGGAQLPLGAWSHVALTYDGSFVRAYVNGSMTRQLSASGTILTANKAPLMIGGRPARANWAGLIDEVEIFNRALTASEVAAIASADAAGKCKAPQPTTAFSRLTHGNNAGTFDVDLNPFGVRGIEPRGASGYQMVVQFANPVATSGGTLIGNGAIQSVNVSGSTVTVNFSSLADAQTAVVRLLGVTDGNSSGDVPIAMGVLMGDANGDGSVNSADATITRNRAGLPIDATTFRTDYNVDGFINSADATTARNRSGNFLP